MAISNTNNVNNSNKSIKASLAPMAGYTDSVFRRICSRLGTAEAVSEMISAFALTMNDRKTGSLARICPGEAPVVLQIFGHDADVMARAADILLSGSFTDCSYATPPAGIDINMGCPVKKIVTSGDGSALMRDTDNAARIVSSVRNVCEKYGVPLSVKFRLGWDENTMNYADFGVAMAKSGAQKITLHCRTRSQFYTPSAHPEHVRILKDALVAAGFGHVPLCGNGDIESYSDAKRYIDLGCDEVAIGRAALGDPWLFSVLADPLGYVAPTWDERIDTVQDFVKAVVEERGVLCGIRESRSRAAYFIKGARGSARIRDAINHAETPEEFHDLLEEARQLEFD